VVAEIRLTLTLYYREGCHLCEAMLQTLRGLQPRTPGHSLSPDGDSPCTPGHSLSPDGDSPCTPGHSLSPDGDSPCLGFDLQLVDVDRDPELARRYDEWVPVLCCDEQEICHYRLDEQALRAALRGQ